MTASSRDNASGKELDTAGYILAVLVPGIGFILGTVLLAKNRVGPGLAVILLSVFCGVLWAVALY